MRANIAKALRRQFRVALAEVLPDYAEDRESKGGNVVWRRAIPPRVSLFVELLFHPRIDAFTIHLGFNCIDGSLVIPEYLDPIEARNQPMARLALFRFWNQVPGANPWYWRPEGFPKPDGLSEYLLHQQPEEQTAAELSRKAADAIQAVAEYAVPYLKEVESERTTKA